MGQIPAYIYNSKNSQVVFDNCFSDFNTTAQNAMITIKESLSNVLSEADWQATLAIWVVIVCLLILCIASAVVVAI